MTKGRPLLRRNGIGGVGTIEISLAVLATLATLFFLRAAAELIIPVVIAVLISYALEPLVSWLVTRGLPRLVATAVVFITLTGGLGWGAYVLREDAVKAVESLPVAARRARMFVQSLVSQGPGADLQRAAAELDGGQSAGRRRESSAPIADSGMSDFVQRGVGAALALAGHATVVFFLVFFLLLSGQRVRARIIEVAGPDDARQQTAAAIIDDVNAQIQRFLLVQLITAIVVAVVTWAVLAWLGVPQAAVWGALAGLCNSIPYLGPVIVSGGLFAVGLVQGGGTSQALQMGGAALVITSIEGWLLAPPLMGRAERMSALAVFLGLLLFTWVWGAWGTILAVPVLVIVKSVADHVPQLKPLGRLMAP
jgi:predicted PurR-regulated permease PerM